MPSRQEIGIVLTNYVTKRCLFRRASRIRYLGAICGFDCWFLFELGAGGGAGAGGAGGAGAGGGELTLCVAFGRRWHSGLTFSCEKRKPRAPEATKHWKT